MKRMSWGLCMAIVVFLLATPAMAQTYDIADYLMLTPGQYKITQGGDPCGGDRWQDATVCSTKNQYTLQTWYGKEGGIWVKEGFDILEITADYAIYHGQNKFEPGEEGYWLLDPPIMIPRSLELNQSVVSQGVNTHGAMSTSYAYTFMLTEAGLTVTTPAGTFNNCLKAVESYCEQKEGNSRIMIFAPGLGEIKSWATTIKDDGGSDAHLENGIDQMTSHGSL